MGVFPQLKERNSVNLRFGKSRQKNWSTKLLISSIQGRKAHFFFASHENKSCFSLACVFNSLLPKNATGSKGFSRIKTGKSKRKKIQKSIYNTLKKFSPPPQLKVNKSLIFFFFSSSRPCDLGSASSGFRGELFLHLGPRLFCLLVVLVGQPAFHGFHGSLRCLGIQIT